MVATSPHYHWCFARLALPAVVAPCSGLRPCPSCSSTSPFPRDRFFSPSLVYVPATLLLLAISALGSRSNFGAVPEWEILHVHYDCPEGPRRYFEEIGADRSPIAEQPPMCLYLEVTKRCNLLCETCPRTFEELEPPADMSWELFTKIVDQVPNIARVVMHGVGEPMLVKRLPDMIRYLKARGTYVLFNTNGTLLQPKRFQELIHTGLDELRVSLDAADREFYTNRPKF